MNLLTLSICTEHGPRFKAILLRSVGGEQLVSGREYIVLKHSSHLICIGNRVFYFGSTVFFFGWDLEGWKFRPLATWQAHETAREGQDRHPKAALVNKKSQETEGLFADGCGTGIGRMEN